MKSVLFVLFANSLVSVFVNAVDNSFDSIGQFLIITIKFIGLIDTLNILINDSKQTFDKIIIYVLFNIFFLPSFGTHCQISRTFDFLGDKITDSIFPKMSLSNKLVEIILIVIIIINFIVFSIKFS